TQEITLNSGENITLTFTWNTTGFAKGNYTIWAYAWPVSGETETSDNTFVDDTIFVSCIGDVNGDRKTDIKDYQLVKNAIPSTPGTPKWNPNRDINNDDKVDIKDYQIVKSHIPSSW
ncbi:MAG: dockerin type I repeat-containing protein, partial [Candidatus Bathyarchaeia archaeon]